MAVVHVLSSYVARAAQPYVTSVHLRGCMPRSPLRLLTFVHILVYTVIHCCTDGQQHVVTDSPWLAGSMTGVKQGLDWGRP